MRSPHTVVLERNSTITGTFATEPYEAGWATEALWFVEPLDPWQGRWLARVQVSPDGLRWCDHTSPARELADGLTALELSRFGTWVRLRLEPDDESSVARVMITLALK